MSNDKGLFLYLDMAKRRKRRLKKRINLFILLIVLAIGAYFTYINFISPSKKIIRFEHLPELPEGFKTYGIDISHHQGEIDWDAFFDANDSLVRFVYCKVTEGETLMDRQWKINRTRLIEEKIPHGGYHFFIPSVNPLSQAKNFLRNYNARQNDLPPALDVETEGVSDEVLIQSMLVWLKEVERVTGKRPIIYTSYNFYDEKFRGKLDGYLFWVANYSTRSDRFTDEQIIHWQFSEKGKIPGIDGFVDLNYSKIDF